MIQKGDIMKADLLKGVLLGAVLLATAFSPCYSQNSTAVFVIYGYVVDENYIPYDDGSIVMVTNISTGQSVSTDVGEGADSGKYCAVFIDCQYSQAATSGDLFEVAVRDEVTGEPRVCREYTATINDIEKGSVLLEDIVELEESSWGAIKSMYANNLN